MPGTSRARNPKGIEIVFEEDAHSYTSVVSGQQLEYVSCTTFLSRFWPQFDPDGKIAARCASREGLTVEQIKAKWSAKGREACRLGTRCHETIEDVLLGRQLRNQAEDQFEAKRFEHGIAMAKKTMSAAEIVGIEKIVFDHELGLAGTIDLLAKSKRDGTWLIIDHKTNAEIPPKDDNPWNKFALDPISHVPDTAFWHYALQLNLYEYLLKYGKYVPRDANFRLFLDHVLPTGAKMIELPDMQLEVRDLVVAGLIEKVRS